MCCTLLGEDGDADPEPEEKESDETAHTSSDAILRDYRYQIQCQLMAHSRDLKALSSDLDHNVSNLAALCCYVSFEAAKVRPVTLVFEPTSVYGVREGYHSALMVTSNDKNNHFRKSNVWRCGVVSSINMLPRLHGSKSNVK